MSTIQWRPEVNALTTPQSYRILFLPRNVVGKKEMAARMNKALPNYSEEEFRAFIDLHNQMIAESLSNGEQVTEENAFTYSLSFVGRLDDPNDPLPPLEECLQLRVYASQPMVDTVRKNGRAEGLPQEKKLPLISTALDTVLDLKEVLNPQGLLQLTGDDLYFDYKQGTGECVIAGTRNGRTVQTRFGKVEDSEIIIMPDIPEQDAPWNNEYTVSISTRYSEHGTLRTGIYSRMLRTPILWDGLPHEGGTGVLTGNAEVPYVTIESGTISTSTSLRIQVVYDQGGDRLLFNLIDLNKAGSSGAVLAVTGNGSITLQGFSTSPVSSMTLLVHEYAALKELIRNNYSSRLLDLVQIELV